MRINSINYKNPNFKAVWSRQTLKTAEKVSEKTGVDVVKKLNDMLDSNPRLKQLGGDKIELSLCSERTEYYRGTFHYQIFCKATTQMPDGETTVQASMNIKNRGVPHYRYGTLSPYEYTSRMSEEQILTELTEKSMWERKGAEEIIYTIGDKEAARDVYDGLIDDIKSQKTQEIKNKYKALMDAEIQAQVPRLTHELYKYIAPPMSIF